MLTVQEKVGQMMLVGFHGLEAPDYLLEWLAEGRIGGVILFGRNVQSPEQLIALTRSIHQAAKIPPLISIDQEGGTVARLRAGFTESPGAMALSNANDPALTERMAQVLGKEMRALGINWDYAPAVDLVYNMENPTVGTRSFGSDSEQVAEMGVRAVSGLQAAGVAACAKHFPGLGNTAIDTHKGLAVLDTSVEHLINRDLIPYRASIEKGLAAIMTTHTVFTTLDPDLPATLSPVIVNRLLRDQLQFQGVVTTDCMEMHAIAHHHSPDESAVLAALAGIDTILFSHTRATQEAAYEGLLAAVESGRVPLAIIDRANERIARLKAQYVQAPTGLESIRSDEHLAVSREAARRGSALLKHREGLLPLAQDQRIALVEFASVLDSDAVEKGDMTGLATLCHERFPQIESVALKVFEPNPEHVKRALNLAERCDLLLLATRNAHLYPSEADFARTLLDGVSKSILICLRNPYDAAVLTADAVIATCGDATPSLEAVIDILAGVFIPDKHLAVTVDLI